MSAFCDFVITERVYLNELFWGRDKMRQAVEEFCRGGEGVSTLRKLSHMGGDVHGPVLRH